MLDNELKRLSAMLEGESISCSDIEALVARTAEVKPWDLLNAVSARDMKRALELYQLQPPRSEVRLFSLLVTRLRELICAKALDARGEGRNVSRVFRGFYKERAHIAADPYSARICATCRLVKTVDQVLETGLAVSSLVLVDDALGNSLVEGAGSAGASSGGSGLVASLDSSLNVLGQGLQLGTNRLVTNASDLIGADALLLRLDVCHFWISFRFLFRLLSGL